MREGEDATVLSYGVTAAGAMAAAEMLAEQGIEVGVVAARFAKPVDRDMVAAALSTGGPVVAVEDHSVAGGFGSAVLETAQEMGLATPFITRLGMPANDFVPHGSRAAQLARCGMDAVGIAATVRRMLGAGSERRAETPRSVHRSVLSRR